MLIASAAAVDVSGNHFMCGKREKVHLKGRVAPIEAVIVVDFAPREGRDAPRLAVVGQ